MNHNFKKEFSRLCNTRVMNTTVAVALITALATIAGGATAGTIGLIAQNRQSKLQQEAQRRQMRRDTYVELLTKHEDVSVALVDIWQAPPPASKSADHTTLYMSPLIISEGST